MEDMQREYDRVMANEQARRMLADAARAAQAEGGGGGSAGDAQSPRHAADDKRKKRSYQLQVRARS
jgi:hypothetical protein